MKAYRTKSFFNILKTWIYLISISLFLIISITGINKLENMLSIFAILCILISLPKAKWISLFLSTSFVVIGLFLLMSHHSSFYEYLSSFGGMFNLLALFSVLPLIAIPINIGGYGEMIKEEMENKVHTTSGLYRMISLYSFGLSSFMNLAALPLMYFSTKKTIEMFPIRQSNRFASLSIIHGYALPILWTPVAPIVGVVLDQTHLRWLDLFPLLFFLSILGLFIDWSLYLLNRKKYEREVQNHNLDNQTKNEIAISLLEKEKMSSMNKTKLKQLLITVGVFIVLIISVESIFSLGLLGTVIFLTIPFALFWSIAIGKGKKFLKEMRNHFITQVPNMGDQFLIFLTAGFFVTSLQVSGNDYFINQYVMNLNHSLGPILFLIIIPFIPLLFAFIGMHPALVISLLAQSLDPSLLSLSSKELSLALLGGAVSTFMIGPFNGTLGMMSTITKTNSFYIARWNIGYTFLFLMLIVITLFLLYI